MGGSGPASGTLSHNATDCQAQSLPQWHAEKPGPCPGGEAFVDSERIRAILDEFLDKILLLRRKFDYYRP